MDKKYLQFIKDLKQNIIQSRYAAMRLANKEQLLLYFRTGKMLSEKIAAEKWGAKVIEQIAEDLQRELPGLRGFSFRNLKKMRQFYEAYKDILIGQSLTGQLEPKGIAEVQASIGQSPTAQLKNDEVPIGPLSTAQLEAFFGISFTHHVLLLNKCKANDACRFIISLL